MTRAEILKELDDFIDSLMKRLPASELKNGWDPERKQKAITMMTGIRDALRKGAAGPKWSIVRTMDSWGVSGELFERACAISNHIQDMASGDDP